MKSHKTTVTDFFAHLVNSAREKNLSTKIVKHNKKKHKNSCWMILGI